jgi:hypothetical protein
VVELVALVETREVDRDMFTEVVEMRIVGEAQEVDIRTAEINTTEERLPREVAQALFKDNGSNLLSPRRLAHRTRPTQPTQTHLSRTHHRSIRTPSCRQCHSWRHRRAHKPWQHLLATWPVHQILHLHNHCRRKMHNMSLDILPRSNPVRRENGMSARTLHTHNHSFIHRASHSSKVPSRRGPRQL